MNIPAFEYEDSIIVVYCGLAFPEDDMLGIDLVIPDISYLKENEEKVKGFFITHGHEDHIGAIPYVMKELNVPIYATKLTNGLIENKLKEHGLLTKVKRKVVKYGQHINLGNFRVEFIRTNHSIQDAAALAATDPECTRNMIIKCASRQFKKGDVLHWWHEGFADGLPRGVRTMISDDRLFLPLAACEYAEVSGDAAIFDEQIPYLVNTEIPYGQQNIYCEMERSDDTETLYEHCCRAVELSFELRGAHGLPLMGTGDWNDGMDAVGWDGGESVVVGWLLLLAARALLPVCKKRGDTARAMLFERESAALRAVIESNAWDKNRYIRAFFGDGTSLGSADCSECAVDCVSECFAVFANAVHAREAFETVLAALTDPVNGLIRLLSPPFDGKTRNAVGYIEGYLPGVRENGGQYTHAAAWCIIAACRLGMADTADSLFKMINPIEHGSANSIERYKGEPYAVAGDVYSVGRLAGRAGWTLYTGSAAWLYRAAVENILGIRKRETKLFVEPCTVLDAFSFEYRFGNTVYSVDMHRSASNAKERHGACVELVDDGKVHNLSLEYR